MNLGEIKIRVQRQFGDESEAQITPDDIVRWANDGMVDIVRNTESVQVQEETSAVVGDGTYELPNDLVILRRVTYEGRPLRKTTLEEIDYYQPGRAVENPSSTPDRYYVWGRILHLYPAPATAGSGLIDIFFVRSPVALVNDGDIPEIPVHMHEDIVRYCITRAKELDEDYSGADRVKADYDARMAQVKYEQNEQADTYGSVRTLPGDDGYGW